MKKFYKIYKLFLSSQIRFQNPERSELLIFDKAGSDMFKNILYFNNYSILEARSESLRVIYFSWKILFLMMRNFHSNLFTCYLISLIKIIKPKIIITAIDNSFKFSEIAKILYKDIFFIAVQNASRYDFDRNERLFKIGSLKEDDNKKFFLPNYYCFGDKEIEDCKKYNINVLKFFKIGSLRLAQYLNHLKKKNIQIIHNKYDIGLISESSAGKNKLWKRSGVEEGFAKIVKFTINVCKRNKLKFTFIRKRQFNHLAAAEMKWYQNFLNKDEFNFLNNNATQVSKEEFNSYKAIHQSSICVGTCSTLLREKLALKGKILASNFTKLDHYDFPLKGFSFIKDPNFVDFENRVLEILKIEKNEYLKQINYEKLIEINDDNTQFDILNKNIRKILN
jgi:surface carbohydrate biosynthesis protein